MSEILLFKNLEKELKVMASPGICPGLERMTELLSCLGNPERNLSAVHVVGSNGKGSTTATLTSILIESGYKVATYTSPHLVFLGERLTINGMPISANKWQEALSKVTLIVNEKDIQEIKPTYFELLTALAFFIMSEEKIDITVVEAGLGGRFDATNALTNILLTLIVSIDIDHMDFLGSSLEGIADEKFSVMRKNSSAIFQGGTPNLNNMFFEKAKKTETKVRLLTEMCAFRTCEISKTGTSFSIEKNNNKAFFKTPLIGAHQTKNSVLALMGAELLKQEYKFNKINERAQLKGVSKTFISGRFEYLSNAPDFIVDGAHNPAAMSALIDTLQTLYGDRHINFIIAMMKDKDIKSTLANLKDINSSIICTEIPNLKRCISASDLSDIAREAKILVSDIIVNPIDAISTSLSSSEITVCCGSLYLVGFVKDKIKDVNLILNKMKD